MLSIYQGQTDVNEHISRWQQLFNLLSQLQTDVNIDPKVNLSLAIELFESQMLTQNFDDFPEPIAGKMRSVLTESHRLLRLLPLDMMFIKAARTPITRQQRDRSYQDKLHLLLQYCQAMIDNNASC